MVGISFRICIACFLALGVGVRSNREDTFDEKAGIREVKEACSMGTSLLQAMAKPKAATRGPASLIQKQTIQNRMVEVSASSAPHDGGEAAVLTSSHNKGLTDAHGHKSAGTSPFSAARGVSIALAAMLPVALFLIVRTWFADAFATKLRVSTWTDLLSNRDLLDERTRRGAGFVLIYIALLVGNDVLANATAHSHDGKYPWNPLVVVFMVEIGKALCSAGMLWATWEHRATPGSPDDLPQQDQGHMRTLWLRAAARTLPVASLYAANNYVVLFILSKIRLDNFVIWRNSSILFNAFFWMVYFKRRLQTNQLIGVGALLTGCCLSTFKVDGTVSFSWPVIIVLFSALASSLGAVFNEGLLKAKVMQDGLNLNGLNLLLYVECAAILSVAVLYQQIEWFHGVRPHSVFYGVDRSAAALILMSVLLGLVISRVLFYTSSITKVMAGGVRELVTIIIAPFFTVSRCDWISMASALWVFLAVVVYFVPSTDIKKASLEEAPVAQQQPVAADVATSK